MKRISSNGNCVTITSGNNYPNSRYKRQKENPMKH